MLATTIAPAAGCLHVCAVFFYLAEAILYTEGLGVVLPSSALVAPNALQDVKDNLPLLEQRTGFRQGLAKAKRRKFNAPRKRLPPKIQQQKQKSPSGLPHLGSWDARLLARNSPSMVNLSLGSGGLHQFSNSFGFARWTVSVCMGYLCVPLTSWIVR